MSETEFVVMMVMLVFGGFILAATAYWRWILMPEYEKRVEEYIQKKREADKANARNCPVSAPTAEKEEAEKK